MKPPADAVETSYRSCRRISGGAGSSFHAGFLLLSRDRRRAMEALYAFMRHTDDLADDPQATYLRRDALTAWRASLERAMLGEFDPTADRAHAGAAILPAVADAVHRFHIPHEHLYAAIEGVEMDLARQRYETFDELQVYCRRVASAVGLACIYIWGFRGSGALLPAAKCGIALQLTNILRDLGEDVAQDRVYLPQADLRTCDYSIDDLRAGVDDPRFRRLMALEIARAEQFYAEGAELIDWLEPPGRRIFGLMMATYRALLRKIARRPAAVFHRRLRLTPAKKLQLLVRWSVLPPRKAALQ